ncbi:MAG: S4 domain-containing protein, partial [Gammaproteobacteria bacterium]|nr:S4 domain-containing protein [Gammaproteobacteria bacterium]
MSSRVSGKPQNEKLQKVLARAGFGSRRELEKWIEAGRVSVNGKIASLGDRVEPDDKIYVDGKPVSKLRVATKKRRVLIYNKPLGEVTTKSDPEG